jgi:hypothetical protein
MRLVGPRCQRPSRVRLSGWVLLTCAGLGLLAGCGQSPGGREAEQVKVKHRLISRLEAMPGARVSARITSGLDAGQNNINVEVHVPASATDAQVTSLADRVERTIWFSHLDPLGGIGIDLLRQGIPDPVLQRTYADSIDRRKLRAKYGPRPDGLPG